jgi:hypothetical protein
MFKSAGGWSLHSCRLQQQRGAPELFIRRPVDQQQHRLGFGTSLQEHWTPNLNRQEGASPQGQAVSLISATWSGRSKRGGSHTSEPDGKQQGLGGLSPCGITGGRPGSRSLLAVRNCGLMSGWRGGRGWQSVCVCCIRAEGRGQSAW